LPSILYVPVPSCTFLYSFLYLPVPSCIFLYLPVQLPVPSCTFQKAQKGTGKAAEEGTGRYRKVETAVQEGTGRYRKVQTAAQEAANRVTKTIFIPPHGQFARLFWLLFLFFLDETILVKLSPRLSESSILRVRGRFNCHFSSVGPATENWIKKPGPPDHPDRKIRAGKPARLIILIGKSDQASQAS
jgi:hypothetical protein